MNLQKNNDDLFSGFAPKRRLDKQKRRSTYIDSVNGTDEDSIENFQSSKLSNTYITYKPVEEKNVFGFIK